MGDVTQHSLPTVSENYAIDPRDSKSLPNHGLVQLRAHMRGAFALKPSAPLRVRGRR